jgi:plastocyanin
MAMLLALPFGNAAVTVQVLNVAGAPVSNTEVYAESVGGQAVSKSQKQVEIEQKDVKFSLLVSAVQLGTPILFPNHDKVRHHVYSFFRPKPFK